MSSNEFLHDMTTADEIIARTRLAVAKIQPQMEQILLGGGAQTDSAALVSQLQAISELSEQAETILYTLSTYAHCLNDIDATNTKVLETSSMLENKSTSFRADLTPVKIFLQRAPIEIVNIYLQNTRTANESYYIHRSRLMAETLLSEKEEGLLMRMSTHGLHAWGSVYNQITGSLRCQLKNEEVGVAQASGLLRSADEDVRKDAWLAIQAAYKTQAIPLANVLNGLAGWRLEELRARPKPAGYDFLSMPIQRAGIERKTLTAMMEAVEAARPIASRAMFAMAKGLGKKRLDPWDLLASAPVPSSSVSTGRTYKEGITIIRDAFASVDASFADFVDMMEKNRWIEGRVLPHKRHGAYCTGFAKSRTPRVFQTYMGSLSDIKTLAHELGHAYHSWIMRDMAPVLTMYPMTLAETASIFAETVCTDHLDRQSDRQDRFACAWQDTQHAVAFLLNIPARFDFEKSLYEKRQTSAFVSAAELNQLTDQAWAKWYGETLSQAESQFWMTKLHFSMSRTQFYNFPYTFGYLFSLGVYARKETLGKDFMPFYIALLRDTGRMSAEDLAMKHLGEDITKAAFWQKSLAVVDKHVGRLESMLSN